TRKHPPACHARAAAAPPPPASHAAPCEPTTGWTPADPGVIPARPPAPEYQGQTRAPAAASLHVRARLPSTSGTAPSRTAPKPPATAPPPADPAPRPEPDRPGRAA